MIRKNKSFKRKKGDIQKKIKAPFYTFAEKLLENLRLVNEVKKCPNCKTVIEDTRKICSNCGTEIKNKLTYEENLDYIRAYLEDKMYTQTEVLHKLEEEVKRLKEIVKNLKLETGMIICEKCNGIGVVSPALDMKLERALGWKPKCSKCNGEGLLSGGNEKNE